MEIVNHYNGNINVKRDGVKHNYTEHELQEYIRCSQDPAYFAINYIKIISLDEGLVPFNLYPYQEEMFKHFNENRFNIVLACRQSGKSISSIAYILWYAVFKPEQNIAILANKRDTAQEMVSRITLALENLPFFLQPGCKALNKRSIEFSNNSKIISAATTGSSIRGLSINLLFLDEFAFVENAQKFYTSTYPVISAGKNTKIIITSTANGIGNPFHKLWEGASQKTNEFKGFTVNWWDVPGRDEEWKRQTIANTSQLQFDQEYNNTFFGTGDTLIDAETLLSLRANNPIDKQEGGDLLIYDHVVKGHAYIMLVDVSKGRGQDYSTFSMIDISVNPFKQVARYKNNRISPLLLPTMLFKYANLYNEAYVIIESNDQGTMVCNGLYNDLEYENMHLESAVKAGQMGIEMTRKSKRIGCSGFKDLLESGKLTIVDEDTIREISTFEARGQSYEASDGNHDDLVMNLVLLGYYTTTNNFRELTDIDIKQMLYDNRIKEIEDDVPFWGYIDDGLPEFVQEEIHDPWITRGHEYSADDSILKTEYWE